MSQYNYFGVKIDGSQYTDDKFMSLLIPWYEPELTIHLLEGVDAEIINKAKVHLVEAISGSHFDTRLTTLGILGIGFQDKLVETLTHLTKTDTNRRRFALVMDFLYKISIPVYQPGDLDNLLESK